MNAAVRLERVFQHISARSVLNDVNLRIEEGEVFVLIGPNGSGKTILSRLILGLDMPTAGLVEVLGKDLGSLGAREFAELRRTTGMVFQGGSLLNDLTVVDNIMLPLRYASLDPEERQRRVRLLSIFALSYLDNARLRRGTVISSAACGADTGNPCRRGLLPLSSRFASPRRVSPNNIQGGPSCKPVLSIPHPGFRLSTSITALR